MSSRSPLLLLSGEPGAARATADELADDGQRVRLVAPGAAPVADGLIEVIRESAGRLLGALGADALPAASWTSLSAVGQLSMLWQARSALADPQVDVVVLDAGSVEQARELIDLPLVLCRLLDALLTPRLAMWRGDEGRDGSAFEGLSRLRAELIRLTRMLEHPRTTVRLVVDADEVGDTVRAMPVFGLLGVGVDGVAARAVAAGTGPESVDWFVGPWSSPVRLTTESLEVVSSEALADGTGGYDLLIPLVGDARREAKVGRCGTDLVVEYAGQLRWLPLPAVLSRCQPTQAVRTAPGLRVRFMPDPALWPSSSAVPA